MSGLRAKGVTATEEFLASLCEKSFLRLWSYANPHKDDGHEFCDVIAVFGDHVFIFFDREKHLADFGPDEDPRVRWERWKRGAIDRQVATAHGAERYLRAGRPIYLDARRTKPLPVPLNREGMVVHKIIVAHGAAEACKNFSDSNVYGSLAISYGDPASQMPIPFPFVVQLDRNNPVHVFDSHNLPIILGELDTVKDFSDYLDAKMEAISKLGLLVYCGEEDLLAHYWRNLDQRTGRHFIGVAGEPPTGLFVGEGEWKDLIQLDRYKATKRANEASYFWDSLIQKTCDNWLNGRLLGDAGLLSRPNAIIEMAKEPRFMRREFVKHMQEAIQQFPPENRFMRHMRFFNSYYETTGYVFLQLWVPEDMRGDEAEYRGKRQEILRIACGAAKNRFPSLETVVGIAIEPPKLTDRTGEDFLWMDSREWTEERRHEIVESNGPFGFFETGNIRERKYSEFVSLTPATPPRPRRRLGRNEPCPCGSGKKFKRCHGA